MTALIDKFRSFPENVKNAIIFLYFSWVWLVVTLYSIDSKLLDPLILICGIALCVLVPKIKNWARALCLLCNVLVILQASILAYVCLFVTNNHKIGLMWVVCIIFFSIMSYYLLNKETAAFFKMHTKKPEESSS